MLWLTKILNGVPMSDLESKVFLFWHLHLTLSLWVQILYPHAKGTSLTLFLWHFCLWKFWKWGKSRIKIFLIFYYSQYIFQYSSLIAKVKSWTVLISNKCNILIITNKVTIQFGGGGEINFSVSVHVFIIKILSTILYLLYVQCKLSQEPFFLERELLISLSLMRVTWQFMYRWFGETPLCTTRWLHTEW